MKELRPGDRAGAAARLRRVRPLFEAEAPEPTQPAPPRPLRPKGSPIYILPNLFTATSLFLALFSLVKASEGQFMFAAWLIIGAAVCDAIDGPVARLTRTSSNFGLQFDSLADVVAFGVAPAFLMFKHLGLLDKEMLPVYAPRLALGACALYAICAAIRLARFNIQAATTEKNHFTGLPSPGAAGAVVSAFLFVEWLTEYMTGIDSLKAMLDTKDLTVNMHRSTLLLMVILAFLMVSEVPFSKLKHILRVANKQFQSLVILLGGACVLITFADFMPVILFAGFAVYIVVSVVNYLRQPKLTFP